MKELKSPSLFLRTLIVSMAIILLSLMCGVSLSAQTTASGNSSQSSTDVPKSIIRIVPYMTPEERQKIQQSPKGNLAPFGAHLTYYGGNVVSDPTIIIVYWGAGVFSPTQIDGTTGNTLTLNTFYTDIPNTTFWDFLTEYNTAGVAGGGTTGTQTIGRGTSTVQEITINPSVTASTIDDSQIQTEITAQIKSGHLPAPAVDASGNATTLYMVYFPHGKTISQGGSFSCQAGGFCAYHGTVAKAGTLNEYFYGVFPDFQAGSGCDTGCGNGTIYENMTSVSSHELIETVTDAEVGLATVLAPPLAWYDNTNGEIGDICNAFDSSVATTRGTYTIQQEFSNEANDCVVSTIRSATHFSVSTPASVQANVPFSITVTAQNSNNATPTQYAGTVRFNSSDVNASLPANNTLTNGAATFMGTLLTTGPQSITATDVGQNAITGSANITVTAASDLSVLIAHTGTFTQGGTGTYSITVSNPGGGATSGTVNAQIFLPAGLTLNGFSGTGWTCDIGTNTCHRSDALAGGGSYPNITLVVNISGSASGSLNTLVQVSGGAELNTANDSGSDSVTIQAATLATITSPVNGHQLGGSSVSFTWNPGSGATKFMLWVGTTYKGNDIYNQQFPSSTTSTTVNGIPTQDNPVYVILWSYIGSVWQRQYYQYTEAGTPLASTMVTPTNYTPFTSGSQTFTWTLGQGITKYMLYVGTTLKGSDIYKGTFAYGTTSVTVNNIPTNADAIYVILWSYINGAWQRNYYYYREAGTPVLATITTPINGSKLAGASQQFIWDPGHGATKFMLYIGTTYKGSNVYNHTFLGGTTSTTVTNIPITGQPLYVILWSYIDGAWQRQYFQYVEAGP